jgi:hypothetical protein
MSLIGGQIPLPARHGSQLHDGLGPTLTTLAGEIRHRSPYEEDPVNQSQSPRRARPTWLWRAAGALLVAASAALVNLVVATPASAAPIAPIGNAFVWADQPTNPNYVPAAQYQMNSSRLFQAINSITRTGVGSYTVWLPNLGSPSGTVLVNAYGFTSNTCKVVNWGPSGTTQTVNVRCFTNAGALADTLFTMSYTNFVTGGRDIGYVWADQPTAAGYIPFSSYQGNSSGAVNAITRSNVGTYTVRLPNLGQTAGHVQVTAYGPGSERCKTSGWGPSGADQFIGVRCFNIFGAPVDTRFTLTYVRDTNVLGNSNICCESDGYPTMYAWANDPFSASYVPSTFYQFSDFETHDKVVINRLGVGQYAVHDEFVNFNDGNVQVTAYGSGSEQCHVYFWNDSAGVNVLCFNSAGALADTLFDVSFTSGFVIG